MTIENTIEQVEKLYTRITGKPAPQNSQNQINPEMDPSVLLDSRIQNLIHVLHDPVVAARLQPFSPPISVWESDDKIMIRLDVAGVKKEDIDISVRGNVVNICGFRAAVQIETGFVAKYQELPFGQFLRSVTLPTDVTPNEVDSKVEDGILEIMVSKRTDSTKTIKRSAKSTQ